MCAVHRVERRAQQPTAPKVANSKRRAKKPSRRPSPSTASLRLTWSGERSPLGANPKRVVHFVRPADPTRESTIPQGSLRFVPQGREVQRPAFLVHAGHLRSAGRLPACARYGGHGRLQGPGPGVYQFDRPTGREHQRTLAGEPDTSCITRVRQERVYGDDVSPLVDISRANAIVNRVEKAPGFSRRKVPSRRLGTVFKDEHIVWPRWLLGDIPRGREWRPSLPSVTWWGPGFACSRSGTTTAWPLADPPWLLGKEPQLPSAAISPCFMSGSRSPREFGSLQSPGADVVRTAVEVGRGWFHTARPLAYHRADIGPEPQDGRLELGRCLSLQHRGDFPTPRNRVTGPLSSCVALRDRRLNESMNDGNAAGAFIAAGPVHR